MGHPNQRVRSADGAGPGVEVSPEALAAATVILREVVKALHASFLVNEQAGLVLLRQGGLCQQGSGLLSPAYAMLAAHHGLAAKAALMGLQAASLYADVTPDSWDAAQAQLNPVLESLVAYRFLGFTHGNGPSTSGASTAGYGMGDHSLLDQLWVCNTCGPVVAPECQRGGSTFSGARYDAKIDAVFNPMSSGTFLRVAGPARAQVGSRPG